MTKCPNCGALLKDKGTYLSCPCCFSQFPKTGEGPSTSGSNTSAASKVYDENIKGVFEILNILDHSVGSGFLVGPELVATNAHVVEMGDSSKPAKEIKIRFDGIKYDAKVIHFGKPSTAEDIALLELSGSIPNTKILSLGDSKRVGNGDEVYCIGNSLGEGLCITKGIVSDKDRIIDGEKFIMSDVAINPGNSGGPLFNQDGEVIAIAVMSRAGANGMKYFIPINNLKDLLK